MESNDSPEITGREGDIGHPRPPFGGISQLKWRTLCKIKSVVWWEHSQNIQLWKQFALVHRNCYAYLASVFPDSDSIYRAQRLQNTNYHKQVHQWRQSDKLVCYIAHSNTNFLNLVKTNFLLNRKRLNQRVLVLSKTISFFFNLKKTLSVESTCLYFSHRLSSIDEYIFHVLFQKMFSSISQSTSVSFMIFVEAVFVNTSYCCDLCGPMTNAVIVAWQIIEIRQWNLYITKQLGTLNSECKGGVQ